LDEQTLYVFKKGDTLMYKGDRIDTFVITSAYKYTLNSDKKNYEMFDVSLNELTKNCKDSSYNYCNIANWSRGKCDNFTIHFRNITYYELSDLSFTNSYPIHNHFINVQIFLATSGSDSNNQKNVQKVYYSHVYGVIAYVLMNGTKYELIKPQI